MICCNHFYGWTNNFSLCFFNSSAKGGGKANTVIPPSNAFLRPNSGFSTTVNQCIQHCLRGGGKIAHAATSISLRIRPGASAGSYNSTIK